MADFAEFIQTELKTKNAVKSDFINYILRVRAIENNSTMSTHSFLYNRDIESGIKLLINERAALKKTCAVFPAFVEYAIVHPTLSAKNASQKSCATSPVHIDQRASLTWFLESNHENCLTVFNGNLEQYEQWIIPMLINEHFTVAVVKFDRTHEKLAFVQYYDSCSDDLNSHFKNQLITFFKHLGYKVKYQCVSKHEQKDNHNCGIFVTLKAIDIANSNIGNPERLLKKSKDAYDYQQNLNAYRYQIGTLLKEHGKHVVISPKLQEQMDNIEKICF